MFRVCAVFCFLVFGCQYQCNRLLGKTRPRNDLYVSSGTLNFTHWLSHFCGCSWGLAVFTGGLSEESLESLLVVVAMFLWSVTQLTVWKHWRQSIEDICCYFVYLSASVLSFTLFAGKAEYCLWSCPSVCVSVCPHNNWKATDQKLR